VILLVVAAVTDFLHQRIPNWVVLAVVALFAIQAARHLHEVSWLDHVGGAAICLIAGLVLYSLNQLGAGDAKLLAALALLSGLLALVPVFFLISVVGIVFAGLLVGARRLIRWQNWDPEARLPKSLREGGGIPYGVAIAIGTILGIQFFPPWLWN
jgi:prepilin peptidase CpaA